MDPSLNMESISIYFEPFQLKKGIHIRIRFFGNKVLITSRDLAQKTKKYRDQLFYQGWDMNVPQWKLVFSSSRTEKTVYS